MAESKPKDFKSPNDMLQWQWRSMIEECTELQRHLSDPKCPCILADSGEYCGPKHALGLHTLAKETIAMAPEHTEMLEELAEEALDQHNALKDRIVCGEPHKDEKDTVVWSRQWRKKLEAIYYHAACKVKLKQETDSCDVVSPKYRYLSSFFKAVEGDYVFATETAVVPRKIDLALQQLEKGVKDVQDSDNFRQFLNTIAKFHHYSLGNTLLITFQKPSASMVAGFNKWKELGRFVKSGERGIMILAPCFPPKTQKEESEEETEEEVEVSPVFFKVVYVFDVAQTEGKEIAKVDVPVLTGEETMSLYKKLEDVAARNNFRIDRTEQDAGGAMGYWDRHGTIWVRPGIPTNQATKTLAHELAHATCETSNCGGPGTDAETIAESVAYVIGQHFGFDTGVRSFPYVALWGKDIKVLKRNLDKIREVSQKLIDQLDITAEMECPVCLLQKEHSSKLTEQLRLIKKAIGELWDFAVEQKGKKGNLNKILRYRLVDNKEARKIKEATGIDIDGYEHRIDVFSINHIINEHGTTSKEAQRGQVAITKDDVMLIPDIVADPDKIESGELNHGLETIKYTKTIGSLIIYIEEARTGKKGLFPVSFYKFKRRAGAPDAHPFRMPPAKTSETFPSSSGHNISLHKSIVNGSADLHFDPLLAAIGCQIGVGCMASDVKPAKLPVCDTAQKKSRESCIKQIKATLPAGCTSKTWNKKDKQEGCVNPFAVCNVSAGCRVGRKVEAK